MKVALVLPVLFSSLVLASPSPVLKARATTITGQWDTVETGTYTVYQDLWNEGAATSGSQTTAVDSDTNGSLAWSSSWTWLGGASQVKSYANAVVSTTSQLISDISSIPTTWDWSYTGSNIIADVSYDIFTSNSTGGSNAYEIMVWLAALGGAGPISSTGSSVGSTTISGVDFDLYTRPNGNTIVYSFVASNEAQSFDGDLMDFFTYLEQNEDYPTSSTYLVSIGAGKEAFTGSDAVLLSLDTQHQ